MIELVIQNLSWVEEGKIAIKLEYAGMHDGERNGMNPEVYRSTIRYRIELIVLIDS